MAQLIQLIRGNNHILSLFAFLITMDIAMVVVFLRWLKKKPLRKAMLWIRRGVLLSSALLLFFSIYFTAYSIQNIRTMNPVGMWLWSNAVYSRFLWSVALIFFVYYFSGLLERWLLGKAETLETRHRTRRGIIWARGFLLAALLLAIWAGSLVNLSVFLGILGAGVALSLQETILCVAGWLLIVIKKPFSVGDRIETQNHIGDVIDIRIFQTSLLEVGNWVAADQSTGRIINLPNSFVFRDMVGNYTKGFPFIWNEIPILVTFESDWRLAKQIILDQAMEEAEKTEKMVEFQIQRMQMNYAIHYQKLKPIVYTSIADSGVLLTLRYLSPVRERRGTSNQIAEGILEEFAKHPSIDFAYPSQMIYATRASRVKPEETSSSPTES